MRPFRNIIETKIRKTLAQFNLLNISNFISRSWNNIQGIYDFSLKMDINNEKVYIFRDEKETYNGKKAKCNITATIITSILLALANDFKPRLIFPKQFIYEKQ